MISLTVVGSVLVASILSGAALEPPVADAAMRGDLAAVKALVARGADVNAAQGDGMTALHWAARAGNEEMAKVLLRARADHRAVTRIGAYTPLHVASEVGSGAVVLALLEAGSDAKAKTTTGVTALHLAAMSGSAATVGALLDHRAEVNATEPSLGQTPLMLAAAAGRVDAVRVLMRRGADAAIAGKVIDLNALAAEDRQARQRRNQTLATFRPSGDSARAWLPTPAQVRAAVEAGLAVERGIAPVGAAVAEAEEDAGGGGGGDEDLAGFTGMVGFHGGLTALHLAAREGHLEVARALLDAGAKIDQAIPADGTTPILLATINGNYDLAKFLLDRGANPKLASEAGATPLYAVINKEWAPSSRTPQPAYNLQQRVTYLELMEALLEAGADPNVRLKRSLWYTTYNRDNLRVDFAGATPFWRAVYATDMSAMRLLLANGADPRIPTLRPAGRQRGAPADTGAQQGGRGAAPAARLDASGLPPVPPGGPGVPAIVAAAGVGYGRGYASNDHRHVADAWLPTIRFLVEELGFDVNARDHDGFTPLHYAAARGDNETIMYLVSKGADVKAVARSGQTTADMANGPVQRISPFLDTVALLERLGSKNNHKCVGC